MKKTYQDIQEFVITAQQYKLDDKFKWALGRMVKRGQRALELFNEQLEEMTIKHAATDDKGLLIRDERTGGYRFTPEKLVDLNKERGKLFRSETDIEPYYATEVPKDLTDDQKEVFAEFVIKPETKLEVVNA